MTTRRTVQTPKGRNLEFAAAMREIRRSSATEPVANRKRYSRTDRRGNKVDVRRVKYDD